MTFRNTAHSWGTLSKALHWIIVLLIINQWVLGQWAESLTGLPKLKVLALHKSFGMTILMLAVIRLAWRWLNPVPDLGAETKPWERVLAKISHVLLYGLIFAMPLTGWLMSSAKTYSVSWFNLFAFPNLVGKDDRIYHLTLDLHHQLFTVLLAVAALHIAGALKHHFIDRNHVLKRMLPFGRVK
jgi:cytochrome b561